jgi:flavin reductase (DIM6/NTAB) family NADH-FMN oxidoreductase RutF
MSHAAATVNVVTTEGPAGRAGVTVSAMTSVSADTSRPTLLVCIHRDSATAAAILANGVFAVNVLRDDQSWISDIFAGRFRAQVPDKFDCADWVPMPSGAPRVIDPLVAFDCRLVSSNLVGTHHVLFGEVGDIFIAERGSALIYARRAYGATARIEAAGSVGEGQGAAANRLRLASFQTISAFALPAIFRRLRDEAPELEVTLIEGDQARMHAALGAGEVELALMYDENIADGLSREVLAELPPYVLLAADHPLAAHQALSARDLAGQPMVLLSTPPSPDYYLTLLREQGVEPQVAYSSSSIETVLGLVGQGLGYSMLASRPASDLTYEGRRLVRRPLAWAARPSRLMLVRRAGVPLSPAAERFAWLCRDAFGADLE